MRKILFQEADFYGASKLIFGNNSSLPICYKATWMHGLSPILKNLVDSSIVIHFNERHLPVHLVNNEDTVKILSDQNVQSIAVGMPFIYTKAHIEKKKNFFFNKLFMPAHSIIGNQIKDYTKWREIIKKYNCDAICLGLSDYLYIKNKRIDLGNIKILKGAHPSDLSSLTRLSEMFYSTNEMISNAGGSHLFYAAASGVKIEIIDEIYDLRDQKIIKKNRLKLIKKFPKKLQNIYELHLKKDGGADEHVLRWNNKGVKEIEEYANYMLGTEHRSSKGKIKKYLVEENNTKKLLMTANLLLNKFTSKLNF